MALPEFRVLPWDFLGSGNDFAAQAQTRWEGKDYLLKVRQNMLFFREVESEQVWASLQPFSINLRLAQRESRKPKNIIARFENIRGDGAGRVFLFKRMVSDFYYQDTRLLAVIRPDGSGIFREFWDEWGLPFTKPEGVPITPVEEWQQAELEAYVDKIWMRDGSYGDYYVAFEQRIIPESLIKDQPLQFVSGSLEQLGQMAVLLAQAVGQSWEAVSHWHYAANSPDGHARLCFVNSRHEVVALPQDFQSLCDLILSENVGVGMDWPVTENRTLRRPTQRGSCEWHEALEGGPISSITLHETLEARLWWAEYLRGKWPQMQIDALFATL